MKEKKEKNFCAVQDRGIIGIGGAQGAERETEGHESENRERPTLGS